MPSASFAVSSLARSCDAERHAPRQAAAMNDAIAPQFASVDGLRVRYAESEPVDGSSILLLNPWPESLYAWEALWPRLSAQARLVAVDLPGFGQSEGREDLYAPRAMGEF